MSIHTTVTENREQIFHQLRELVSFNSVHNEPGTEEDLASAANWVADAFAELGFTPEKITTEDGSTAIIARKDSDDPHAPRVLLYSHYDIVPVGDPAAWTSDPWTLTERDGRWYARGAADCKGNVVMHLAALRAVEANGGTKNNITVLVEGSEERGGAGLDALIKNRPELFAADTILIADNGNAAVGVPSLTTSLRGGAQIDVTVRTLANAVHSGSFGGAAPDAVFALMRTLDTLRDEKGRTVIDGVESSARWEGKPYEVAAFRSDAQVLDGVDLMGDEADNPADFVWSRPAITVTGFSSTPVDQAVNAIPPVAQARLNLRVPAHMDSGEIAHKVAEHLKAHVAFHAQIEVSIDDVNPGFASDPTQPAQATLSECLAEAYDTDDVTSLGQGGSIPLTAVLHEAHPNAEIVLFGVEEPTCTIHSVDESVDPTEIEHVAIAEALFLQRFGQ